MASPYFRRWRPQAWHHQLMLLLSIPMLLWMLSGAYFVWMDLGYIRGDHYQQPVTPIARDKVQQTFAQVLQLYPQAANLNLVMLIDTPHYRVKNEGKWLLIDAITGKLTKRISQQQASEIAYSVMPQTISIKAIDAFIEKAPSELSAKHLPVWRVSFNDAINTSIYVSMHTGDIVTRRHDYWRIFDLLWRIHIMDYDDGANIRNPLLMTASLLAFIAIVCGILWQLKWLKRRRI